MDIESVHWLPPSSEPTPTETLISYRGKAKREAETDRSTKVFADLSRICELEDSEQDWRDFCCEYQPSNVFPFAEVQKCFDIRQLDYSNVDIYALKMQLVAQRRGYTGAQIFGVGVRVVGEGEECSNEVRRFGLVIERHADVELRVGDLLIFYYSKSPEEIE